MLLNVIGTSLCFYSSSSSTATQQLTLASVENGDTWGPESNHGAISHINRYSTSGVICRVTAVGISCMSYSTLMRFSFWIALSESWVTKRNWWSESQNEDLEMRRQRQRTWRIETTFTSRGREQTQCTSSPIWTYGLVVVECVSCTHHRKQAVVAYLRLFT